MTKHRRVSVTIYPDEEKIISDIKKSGWASCDASALRRALWFYREQHELANKYPEEHPNYNPETKQIEETKT